MSQQCWKQIVQILRHNVYKPWNSKYKLYHTIKTYHYTLSVMSASRFNDIPHRSYQQVA